MFMDLIFHPSVAIKVSMILIDSSKQVRESVERSAISNLQNLVQLVYPYWFQISPFRLVLLFIWKWLYAAIFLVLQYWYYWLLMFGVLFQTPFFFSFKVPGRFNEHLFYRISVCCIRDKIIIFNVALSDYEYNSNSYISLLIYRHSHGQYNCEVFNDYEGSM